MTGEILIDNKMHTWSGAKHDMQNLRFKNSVLVVGSKVMIWIPVTVGKKTFYG